MNEIDALNAQLAAARTPQQKVDALNALAWGVRDTDITRGKELAREAYQLAQNAHYPKGIADSLITQSHFLFSDFVLAISNGLKALEIYEQLNDRTGQGRALYTLCWAHWGIDNFAEAIDTGQRALKLAQETGNQALEADVLNNLGLTYKRAGNYELGFSVYNQALAIYRELSDPPRVGKVLTNIALAYAAQGNYTNALVHALECLELEIDSPLVNGYNFLALGQIYTGLRKFDEALLYLPMALSIAKKHALEALALAVLQSIGEVHLARQEYDQAIENLQQAIAIGEEIHSNLFLFRCHEILSDVYEKRGELVPALAHYKQYHQIKEKVFNDNDVRRRQILEIYHHTEIARREAEIFQLRNVELEQEINERKRVEKQLERQASTDVLTSISNRRYFLTRASKELQRAQRLKLPLALALIDIDHFKEINDTYGHSAGDRGLIAFTKVFLGNIRAIDLLARFGGDEFVLLFPETDLETAGGIVERLQQALAMYPIDLDGKPITITVSVGLSSITNEKDKLDLLLKRADDALYRAKQAGRNCIKFHYGE